LNHPLNDPKRYRKKTFFSPLIVGVLLFISLLSLLLLFISPDASSKKDINPKEEEKVDTPTTASIQKITVRDNDTFYSIMLEFGVTAEEILRIARKSKDVYDLRHLKKGDTLYVEMVEGELEKIEYRYRDLEWLLVERDSGGGYRAERFDVPYVIEPTLVHGTIEDSLYEAGIRAGLEPRLIHDLSDVFAWDVDFAMDIRKGDTFTILFETLYVDDLPIGTGRILGADIVNSGDRFTAIYFEDSKGRGDYYDELGKSLTRTLLKSPLRYRRISSYFTKRRFHPILKRHRPHHGIDYAAPSGTPVESSGDGRVVFAGRKRGYGKYIKIRHNATYTTAYGHLSRIKKGIKKGKRIRQGEIIGYVGSTGLSTGPHLHYEVLIRGRYVNPLSVKSKSKRNIAKEDLPKFKVYAEDITARLSAKGTLVALADGY
jgi:murein DD-endopeptidase MepM/ murein hydrolase activator NlpD